MVTIRKKSLIFKKTFFTSKLHIILNLKNLCSMQKSVKSSFKLTRINQLDIATFPSTQGDVTISYRHILMLKQMIEVCYLYWERLSDCPKGSDLGPEHLKCRLMVWWSDALPCTFSPSYRWGKWVTCKEVLFSHVRLSATTP